MRRGRHARLQNYPVSEIFTPDNRSISGCGLCQQVHRKACRVSSEIARQEGTTVGEHLHGSQTSFDTASRGQEPTKLTSSWHKSCCSRHFTSKSLLPPHASHAQVRI